MDMLLYVSRVYDIVMYPKILAAILPLMPSPGSHPLNRVLIMPDGDEEIMRWMFELFDEVAIAGGILRACVLFPCVSVLVQDATSDQ